MTVLHRITEPGDHKLIEAIGTNRNEDIGVLIDVWGNDPVNIDMIEAHNCFIPVIKQGNAPVTINGSDLSEFGGDGFNITGSNLTWEVNKVHGNTPTRPYKTLTMHPGESVEACLARHEIQVYDPSLLKVITKPDGTRIIGGYHVDGGQCYALPNLKNKVYASKEQDILTNLIFKDLEIVMDGAISQGISFTERCRYDNIQIGTKRLKILVDYYYSIIATNMFNFVLGNSKDVEVNKPVRLENSRGDSFCRHLVGNGKIYIPGDHVIPKSNKVSILGKNKGKVVSDVAHDDDSFNRLAMSALKDLTALGF